MEVRYFLLPWQHAVIEEKFEIKEEKLENGDDGSASPEVLSLSSVREL